MGQFFWYIFFQNTVRLSGGTRRAKKPKENMQDECTSLCTHILPNKNRDGQHTLPSLFLPFLHVSRFLDRNLQRLFQSADKLDTGRMMGIAGRNIKEQILKI